MTSQYGSSRRIDRITPLFFADCCRCYLEFFGSTSLSSQMLHYGFRHRTSAYISQTDKQYFRHDRKDNIKTKKHTLQRTQLTDRYLRYNLPYCFNGRTFCKVLNSWCVRCSGDDARRAGKKERKKEGRKEAPPVRRINILAKRRQCGWFCFPGAEKCSRKTKPEHQGAPMMTDRLSQMPGQARHDGGGQVRGDGGSQRVAMRWMMVLSRWRSQRRASAVQPVMGARTGRRLESAATATVATEVYITVVVRGMANKLVSRK